MFRDQKYAATNKSAEHQISLSMVSAQQNSEKNVWENRLFMGRIVLHDRDK
jgi:hypothetical protein